MKTKISIVCLNPQGKLDLPAPSGLKNPRVKDLAGKKIGIFWDGKKGGDNFCIAVEELLNKQFPTAKTLRIAMGDIDALEKAKKEIDTFIYAVGDSGMGGWGQSWQVITLEKVGKPGIFVVGSNAIHTAKMSAHDSGMPALRHVVLPAIDYFPNRATVAGLRPVAKVHFKKIVDALTSPLTPEEKNPALTAEKQAPATVKITAESYGDALEKFNKVYLDNHWGDGLPLIPPTREAVDRMLNGTTRAPDEALGKVPYRNGIATIEKIAVNAVMAGAKPEYLPVIITAMECLIQESNFTHMMSSEGAFTLAIMVSGPIGKEIGMNCGVGLLGHGFQANNTIGRAVRLCLINLGYLWPGEIDMALIGRPSPHTFYTFAENIEESPWESFNSGLGYAEKDSCVTVSTAGGHGGMGMTIYGGGVVEPWDVKEVLQNLVQDVARNRSILAAYKLGVGNPFAHFKKHIMIIHPEMAIIFKRAGYPTKAALRDYLWEAARVPYEELTAAEKQGIEARMNTKPGGAFFVNDAIPESQAPVFKAALKKGGRVPVVNPDDIHIIVSGTIPGYSFGMTYLRTGHMTKKITGAALTKSGR